ncbi:MAG TPA: MarR family winged helix-turn-helix transcriptional regulator [Burkholderiaceae bacterium]|jgi:DNA-binding MarR family transcriptional regulator|nr:MarR family winged helix-turn-helix transcriptional regulator [Burkholderiaceae bacterium]
MVNDAANKGVAMARKATRECMCANLRRATRVMTKLYDEILKPSGLKVTQFGLLSNLMALGSSTLSELAHEMLVDRTTLTRNLEVLETKGLVVSEEGEDRRERQLRLSDKGIAAVSAAYPLWQAAQARAMDMVGRPNWSAGAPLLHQLATHARPEEDSAG